MSIKTLKTVYGLRAGEAREVLAHMGTSQADCVERCVEKAVNKAKKAAYVAREAGRRRALRSPGCSLRAWLPRPRERTRWRWLLRSASQTLRARLRRQR